MKYLGILVIALSFVLVCSLSLASQPYGSIGASTESVLYTFMGGTDGGYPYSALSLTKRVISTGRHRPEGLILAEQFLS